MLDRSVLFDRVRASLFGGTLTKPQVEGVEAILDEWQTRGTSAVQPLAYVLATAYHETGRRMAAVRETFADTDEQAIARLDAAFAKGQLSWVSRPYWRKDAKGRSWFGRGLVQLTHEDNYRKMGAILGVDLVADPSRALELRLSAAILVEGMVRGTFTGKKLADYFPIGGDPDWRGARKIVNGTDRADDIAGYARKFNDALMAAARPAIRPLPIPPVPVPPPPDIPAPSRPQPRVPPAPPAAPEPQGFWARLLFLLTRIFGGRNGTV